MSRCKYVPFGGNTTSLQILKPFAFDQSPAPFEKQGKSRGDYGARFANDLDGILIDNPKGNPNLTNFQRPPRFLSPTEIERPGRRKKKKKKEKMKERKEKVEEITYRILREREQLAEEKFSQT